MKIVQACGCSYEDTTDGGVDQLVCATHAAEDVSLVEYLSPEDRQRIAEKGRRLLEIDLMARRAR